MVSTRGVRYKFSEGERVLCYEPDPTKAKVLYDSKVLEVIESKDKRGRRTVEYLIHFQGWNSSWDRCVSEDFVLKDTEENRQLQRDLAEKSQLQLGAYLYRRERKKGSGSSSTAAGSGAGKRARSGFSDDGSSSSTQPEEGELGDSGSSSSDGSGSQPQSPQPPLAQSCRATINIPSSLRDRLTFDYHLVVKRGKLVRLPASPCVADILESFVKWYARAGAWHPQRSRYDPPHKPDMTDVSCRLNLVREVADGLRVYFDFVLRGHLLYKQELEQYYEVCGQYLQRQEEEEDALRAASEEAAAASAETGLKSPKLAEYSHLPPDPSDIEKNGGTSVGKNNDSTKVEEAVKTETSEMPAPAGATKHERTEDGHHQSALTSAAAPGAAYSATPAPAAKQRENRVCTRSTALARRLRSHKSAVSQSEHEEPAASTSAPDPRAFETLSSSLESSGSSLGEGWPAQAGTPGPSTRTPISVLLDKVSKWELITRLNTLYLPCRIYGAVHIARLFVKLPEFLSMTAMSDYKLKIVIKHVDLFVQFLDEHIEWFGEPNYVDNTSRLH